GDEVDGLDAFARELFAMARVVALREERGVDLRMQCLHPSAEKRGTASDVLDRARRDALARERGASAIGGDEIPSELTQRARECDETGAIRDREEGSQRGQDSHSMPFDPQHFVD